MVGVPTTQTFAPDENEEPAPADDLDPDCGISVSLPQRLEELAP